MLEDIINIIPDAATDSEDAGTFTFDDVTVDVERLPDLTGRFLPEFNQAKYRGWIYNNTCTIANTSVDLCYVFLWSILDEIEPSVQEAVKRGYKLTWWRESRLGMTAGAKAWNERHPGDEIVWWVSTRGDPMLKTLLNKGYPIWCTKRLSTDYLNDAQEDWIVSLKNTTNRKTWHRATLIKNQNYTNFKKIEWATSDIMIRNDFVWSLKYNGYVIEYLDDLVKNGVYYPAMYWMIPQKFIKEQLEDIKEAKRKELEAKYGPTPYDLLQQAKKMYALGESIKDQSIMDKMRDLGIRLRKKFPEQLNWM